MNLSRFSVLAVFFMMIMSAFVAVPTYNVGADEHEGGPYLNAFPTGSGGDPEDYEMSLDVSEGGANITVEATELIDELPLRLLPPYTSLLFLQYQYVIFHQDRVHYPLALQLQ